MVNVCCDLANLINVNTDTSFNNNRKPVLRLKPSNCFSRIIDFDQQLNGASREKEDAENVTSHQKQ